MQVQVVHDSLVVIPDKHQENQSVLDLCTNGLGLSANYVRQLVSHEKLTVKKRAVSTSTLVSAGQRMTLHGGIIEGIGVDLSEVSEDVYKQEIQVLFEDDHLMVVNKPPGLIIYPGPEGEELTLAHLVALYYQQHGLTRKVRHVHRLDRDTTGTILYAKHSYSARALDAALSSGQVRRTYLALVHGRFTSTVGTIDLPIGRDRHYAGRYRVSPSGKTAVTDYRVLDSWPVAYGHVSLVECRLRTGRTHQIRVHFSELGHPIVGDELYAAGGGVGVMRWPAGHALHAWRLRFVHPYEHREVEVEAPLPKLFAEVVNGHGTQALK